MAIDPAAIAERIKVQCGLTDDKQESILGAVKSFALGVIEAHEWSFLEADDTDVTVANQSDYTLQGAVSDCGLIKSVYYEGVELDFKDTLEFARLTKGATGYEGDYPLSIWTSLTQTAAGWPRIRIFGTPKLAGKSIYYQYRKKIDEADPQNLLPAAMSDLLEVEGIARFHPDPGVRSDYERRSYRQITTYLKRYRKTTIAHRPGRIDPLQKARNYEINILGGYRNLPQLIVNR